MTGLDALVIGGGPAGCACAIWMQQLDVSVTVVEKRATLGGLQAESPYVNDWIPGVLDRTGMQLALDLDRHVRTLEIPTLRRAEPTRIERGESGFLVRVESGAAPPATLAPTHLVIATGVVPRTGGLPAGPDIVIGPGRALESREYRGRSVAILGGGDNAAENWVILAEKSPARLAIFARTLRARPQLLAPIPPAAIHEGPYRVDPERRTVTHAAGTERFDVLVVLYGWEAQIPPALAPWRSALLDARGFVHADAERQTRVPGLWAIGEVAQAVDPCVVTAMSDGVICARAIERRLRPAAARVVHEHGGAEAAGAPPGPPGVRDPRRGGA